MSRKSQIILIAFLSILLFAVHSHAQEEIYRLERNRMIPFAAGLQPKISPENPTVRQGESITFKRTSIHDPDSPIVREDWEGPSGQRGSGSEFTVRTDQLSPAKYTVKLTVVDSRNRQGTATATFEIVLQPSKKRAPKSPYVPPSPASATPTPKIEPLPETPHLERPHAIISPRSREVKQGELANFESRSTPITGLHESWLVDQTLGGEGSHIKISTQSLPPGTHTVTLTVTDNLNQRSSDRAFLYITEAPKKPAPSPEQRPPKPSARPPQQYRVQMIAKPEKVELEQPIILEAKLKPPRENVRYRFNFGDNSPDVTLNYPEAKYKYKTKGTFQSYVEVALADGRVIARSDQVTIQVVEPYPVRGKIAAGAAGIIVALLIGYLLWNRSGRQKSHPSITPLIRVVPMADRVGTQEIEGKISSFTGPEICLKPVSDLGTQEITDQREPFIKEERRDYE